MIALYTLFESKYNIVLSQNDPVFLKSIKDYKEMYYSPSKYNHYYTVMYNNKKAGIVGVLVKNNLNFFQIAIHQDFRGGSKGIFKEAVHLIVKKHNLNTLTSTIESDNISSIKAHLKVGFVKLPVQNIKRLIDLKKLKLNQIRMTKEFKV